MGLSTYANLLSVLSRLATPGSGPPPSRPATFYVDGIVRHARVTVVALFAAWLALMAFAAFRIFVPPSTVTAEAAAATARATLVGITGQQADALTLKSLDSETESFELVYLVPPNVGEATVTVSRRDGAVTKIRRPPIKTPTPAASP